MSRLKLLFELDLKTNQVISNSFKKFARCQIDPSSYVTGKLRHSQNGIAGIRSDILDVKVDVVIGHNIRAACNYK